MTTLAQGPADYAKTVEMADNYLQRGDLINAKASYQYATQLDPDAQYPKDKLQETLGLIKDQMQNSNLYASKVLLGDEYFNNKDYINALKLYREALSLMPGDKYTTEKVSEISKMLEQAQLNNERYSASINEGDRLLQNGEYEKALDQYIKAAEIKPDESYPSDRIAQVQSLIVDKKAKADDFSQAVQSAENFMSRERFEEAIEEYEKALKIKPDDTGAAAGLEKAKALKISADEYSKLVQEGDNLYIDKQFTSAREKYLQAGTIRPDDEYPRRMIEKVDIALQDITQSSQSDYEIAIARADRYYNEKDYDNAIAEYNNALRFKPDGEYAKKRIEDITKDMQMRQMTEDAYNQSISKADNLFKEEKYEEAMFEFKTALTYKPLEKYPKVKINEIEDLLAQLQDKREQYLGIIQGADKLFFADDYADARVQYRKAAALFPDDKYPKDQITMINEILGERDVNVKVVTDANQVFEIKQPTPEELAQRDFELKMQFGDELFLEGKFEEALVQYQAALEINPGASQAQEKIAGITKTLEEIATAEQLALEQEKAEAERMLAEQKAEEERLLAEKKAEEERILAEQKAEEERLLAEKQAREELDRQYAEAISKADGLLEVNDYANAIAGYQEALALKPEESYPQEKITGINKTLEELAAAEQLALEQQKAEAERMLAEQKAAEERLLVEKQAREELDRQYAEAISKADGLLEVNDYANAIAGYQEALALKPEESYPQEKITGINKTLEELAAAEQLALEQQKAEAERILAEQKAEEERLLAEKKAEEERILAEQKAEEERLLAEKKAEEERILAEQTAEEERLLAEKQAREELDRQYAEALASAEQYLADAQYDEAMSQYQDASNLKPSEEYPRQKIIEVVKIREELARQQEVDSQFAEAVLFADKHFASGDYDNAIKEYKVANGLKPGEQYPADRLREIETIRLEQQKQKEIDANYAEMITRADDLYNDQDYEGAILALKNALEIKPGDEFAAFKLKEVERTKATLEAELEDAYNMAILNADNYFNQGDFEMAKLEYERAADLKAQEVYPLDQLKKVNEQLLRQRQIIQEAYDKAIADADKFYAGKIYDDAIDAYRTASELKTSEEYPREMVSRILKLISERAIVQINKDPVLIKDNTTRKFDFVPVSVKDRKSNYIFFKASSKTPDSYKVIISFGQDQAKNGGMVIRIPKGIGNNDFIVRISAQYKWFSEDNNWLTFYPEGGDIEVSLVQISYSD